MVGDDDEVEVARQERWLQRIREQFDAEHDATQASNGYHTGDVSPDTGNDYHTGNGFPAAAPHTNGNGFAATPQHNGNGYHPEPTYDTHSGYTVDGYAPAAGNGFHADPSHSTGNGFHADPPSHTTGNGFDAAADHTGNGYHPDPAYNTPNGHAADTGDEGWLPPEQSWLSNTGGTQGFQEAGASQQNGQWSQAAPVADEYPVHRTTEPSHDTRDWRSDSWDSSEQTQRWLPPASTEAAPAAQQPPAPAQPPVSEQQPPAPPARSWREERAREPADDVWSTPSSTTSDGEWATIPPPATPSPVSSTGQWDTSQPPEQNGWSSQPLTRYEPTDQQSTNGNGTNTGWQRWEPDPYLTQGNGADPAFGGQRRNGYHGSEHNGQAPAAHADDPYAHSNGAPPEHAPAPSDGWLAPVDNRSEGSDDFVSRETPADASAEPQSTESERVEDPVRELLDIWSPKAATGDGSQQGPTPDAAPTDTAVHDSNSIEPAAPSDSDQWHTTGGWAASERNGHHADGWGASERNGHHTDGRAAPERNGDHTDGWEPADQWQVDYTPGANEEPHELPPEHLTPPSTSHTTDPFEALHSLQSQLNRLGGGRRAPRRYGD